MAAPIRLGSLLFTAVEPHRGHEVEYNRWYEYDHFYAGCMVGAHQFSGRRFVATADLNTLRSPANSPMCPDPTSASYLAIYWVLDGFHSEWSKWAVETVTELHAEGRMFAERDHVHTGLYTHSFATQKHPLATSIELALDRDFAGLVVTAGELADGASMDDIQLWTNETWGPEAFAAGWGPEVIGTSTLLPLPKDAPGVGEIRTDGSRFIQLHFCDHKPNLDWDQGYATWGDELNQSGLATHIWTAPYIPTVTGTDTYTDQLW